MSRNAETLVRIQPVPFGGVKMDINDIDNAEEVRIWIKKFKAVMKMCPKNIWFFSNGELSIMVLKKNGERGVNKYGGVDHDYQIDQETKHVWEGGDW